MFGWFKPRTYEVTVTEEHLDRAIKARRRSGDVMKTCLLAQAVSDVVPDFKQYYVTKFESGKRRFYSTDSWLVGDLVRNYDDGRYDLVREKLPHTTTFHKW